LRKPVFWWSMSQPCVSSCIEKWTRKWYAPLYHCCNSFLSKFVDFCSSFSWSSGSFLDCLQASKHVSALLFCQDSPRKKSGPCCPRAPGGARSECMIRKRPLAPTAAAEPLNYPPTRRRTHRLPMSEGQVVRCCRRGPVGLTLRSAEREGSSEGWLSATRVGPPRSVGVAVDPVDLEVARRCTSITSFAE